MRLLYLSSLTYLRQHPLQLLFSILGIALGVAIAVGMDLAIFSAKKGFNLSVNSLSGMASHRIVATNLAENAALPEAFYVRLRTQLGVKNIAPLIKTHISLPEFHHQKVRFLGIDPFSESSLRSVNQQRFEAISGDILQQLLTQKNSILVSSTFLAEHGLKQGDWLAVNINHRLKRLQIIASYDLKMGLKSQLKNWIFGDISTAQELLNIPGYISQIDLNLAQDNQVQIDKIREILPPDLQLLQSNQYRQALSRLSESFELNLTALSLLGLLIAMFLIYNTTMFSVVQRRDILARLRVMGVTRQELFVLILSEALLIAMVATILGILLGFALASVLVGLISQTINDLYYSLQVSDFSWSQISIFKALLLGLGVTLLSATFPAFEAAFTKPVKALQRIDLETKTNRWIVYLIAPGLLGCIWVYVLIQDKEGDMLSGFIAVFVLIVSLSLLLPWLTRQLLKLLALGMQRLFALPGKMAVKNIERSLSRSIIAIAALTIAVSATLGIGIMIQSFRFTVDEWLGGYLRADFFIAPIDNQSLRESPIKAELMEKIAQLAEVKSVSSDRRVKFFIAGQYHQLIVLNIPRSSFSAFRLKKGDPQQAEQAWFEQQAVIVSEPYAYRHAVDVGDWISLDTDKGPQRFKIAGVFYHYGSEQGMINMSQITYQQYWQDKKINSMGVYLQTGADPAQVEQQLLPILAEYQLQLSSKTALHRESMQIFDRTFKITQVLKILVVIVSFVGILSALMAIELERAREFAILRVLGLTPGQLSLLVYLETLVMGLIAALLAMPMGIMLAYLLVEVINYRSFGWSMLFILPPQEFIFAALLALFASLLAAVYPAWSLARTQPALSLRGE